MSEEGGRLIRCSSKALLIRGNEILLNCCAYSDGTPYFDLPGGGQDPYESMEEALLREIREETGYTAQVLHFAALSEEIYDDPDLRQKYPDYSHRILHIFVAAAVAQTSHPTDYDFQMRGRKWFSLDEADKLPLLPETLRGRVREVLAAEHPVYLGTIHTHQQA